MQRATKQRTAIQQAVEKARRPLSPQEVLELAQEKVPTLGIATVYRAVSSLVDEGVLRAVEIPGQSPRYEMAGLAHHHHFCCMDCGQVFDLQGCPMKPSYILPKGFKVESHEVTLFGQCPECSR